MRRARLRALAAATRGRVTAHGLRLRPAQRPTPTARRRILAAATSTGLAAPLFVLDGLPAELADPAGADWDMLGRASVVAAATTIRTAPSLAGPAGTDDAGSAARVTAIGGEATDLLHRATPWVRAAGVPGVGIAGPRDLQEAEEALDLTLSTPTVTEARVERLRRAQLHPAEDVVRALGLLEGGRAVTADDVLAAADALGVPTPGGCTPELVAAVAAVGAEVVTDQLDRVVGPYARALGLDTGAPLRPGDTATIAAELGIELPAVPSGEDATRLHHAWLQTLAPHFARFGLDAGARVDPADTVALARALGADVDRGIGPAELDELLQAFDAQAAAPAPYGVLGGATLHLPSIHVVRAGWHQSSNPAALVPEDLGAGRAFVLPSRGRGSHERSAIDVAVEPGTPVLAPVTGTVVEATGYMLYGTYPDARVRIRPDDAPSTIVTALHVTGPQVQVGDHVQVGEPIAAHATKFPFRSQIDDVVGPLPHVHIEASAG